jgi:hypothetical protein
VSQPYTTRTGLQQIRPSLRQLERAIVADEGIGFCLACGAEAGGVEPDARKYPCESCRAPKVYGAEELMIMGIYHG